MFYARKKLAQLVARGHGNGCGPGIALDEFMERQMPIFDTLKSIFAGAAAEPPSPPELDSTSEATLSQSLGRLSLAGPGWITMQEARRLFSPMDDHYAFGETDDQGRDNLARFAKQHDVRVDIMPTEGRIYFSRGAR